MSVNKRLTFALLMLMGATGFSQSLSFPSDFGEHFQRTNLDIRWEAPSNAFPPFVWIYRVLPRRFPSLGISNLIIQCGLTEKNLTKSNADIVIYCSAGRHPDKQLEISKGSIFYIAVNHYGPTNLARSVPEMSQMPELTTNFLANLGIGLSEIKKNPDGSPKFRFIEPFKEYFLPDGTVVTNIEFREVGFGRSVDGAKVLGTAGYGDIYFGDHSVPTHIDLSWNDFERYKSCPTATPDRLIKWVREGKAVQQGIPMNLPPIDWTTVKTLTVKEANLCYYAGERFAPSGWLMPLVSLWTTVDTGNGNIEVEIDCPIIDEIK